MPPLEIGLVISHQLRGKFLLSDYEIKSISPDSEATVTLKLIGNPNVHEMKEPIQESPERIIIDQPTLPSFSNILNIEFIWLNLFTQSRCARQAC